MIRFGLIGAGAAMEQLHLPAMVQLPDPTAAWIVDVRVERARQLSKEYSIPHVTNDYTQVADVEAVLVATPNSSHAPISEFFLNRGVHVLCEKPLSTTVADANRLVTTAQANHLVLAAGVFRRYYPVSAFIRRAIAAEWLGPVQRIDAEEGTTYGWSPQSRFMMDRDKKGDGVLIDTGSHTIDRLLWWLGSPEATLESYHDNSETGLETDCEIHLSVPWRGRTIPVRVELSRSRALRNTFQVWMTSGRLECSVNVPDKAWFHDQRLDGDGESSNRMGLDLDVSAKGLTSDVLSYFADQLDDFCKAIRFKTQPQNAGMTVLPLVRLIETCYAQRQPLLEPWVRFGIESSLLKEETPR